MSSARDRPLWTCPTCGAQLVGVNMAHACGNYSVETFLSGRGPRARELFWRYVELVRACGPITFAPAKTRVALMVRVRFTAVTRLSERSLEAEFGLPYRLESPRISRIDDLLPDWKVHWLRVHSPDEFDQEVRGWLCASYRLMGQQERLLNRAAPARRGTRRGRSRPAAGGAPGAETPA